MYLRNKYVFIFTKCVAVYLLWQQIHLVFIFVSQTGNDDNYTLHFELFVAFYMISLLKLVNEQTTMDRSCGRKSCCAAGAHANLIIWINHNSIVRLWSSRNRITQLRPALCVIAHPLPVSRCRLMQLKTLRPSDGT